MSTAIIIFVERIFMKRIVLLIAFSFSLSIALHAQQGPLSVDDILKEAFQQATKEKKNVLVMFHASWCGWCHKMDSSLNDKSCKKFFDDNFVIRHLTVDEYADKKTLENPGVYEFRAKFAGADQAGLPFWIVFDKNGNLIADSQIRPEGVGLDQKGESVGCPAAEKEVAYFISILKKTTKLNDQQLSVIEKRFRKNEN
jgi:thioredoxin-related protein